MTKSAFYKFLQNYSDTYNVALKITNNVLYGADEDGLWLTLGKTATNTERQNTVNFLTHITNIVLSNRYGKNWMKRFIIYYNSNVITSYASVDKCYEFILDKHGGINIQGGKFTYLHKFLIFDSYISMGITLATVHQS